MKKLGKNLHISLFFIMLSTILYGQNRDRNDIYRDIQNTDKLEMGMMIEFLTENETDFTTNTDKDYLLNVVYKKSQAFLGLQKLYLKDKYNLEVYLFYSTSSHTDTYIMLYNGTNVCFLGKDTFENDLNCLLLYIDKNVDSVNKFSFLQEISKIFIYMIKWNYRMS